MFQFPRMLFSSSSEFLKSSFRMLITLWFPVCVLCLCVRLPSLYPVRSSCLFGLSVFMAVCVPCLVQLIHLSSWSLCFFPFCSRVHLSVFFVLLSRQSVMPPGLFIPVSSLSACVTSCFILSPLSCVPDVKFCFLCLVCFDYVKLYSHLLPLLYFL